MSTSVTYRTSPSLALIKYWGKADQDRNTPATSSLAVTLDGLYTETTVELAANERDSVTIDGKVAPSGRFERFFDEVRRVFDTDLRFSATSTNSFPTAAGLASSASGFAALACGCAHLIGGDRAAQSLSAIARVGSASAARSLFGGFTVLEAKADAALQIHGPQHWPELRIVVAAVTSEQKPISSRDAMERARTSSPFYETWVEQSKETFREAKAAIAERDIERLGRLMRSSYLAMFSTMFTSRPPVIYWHPRSLEIIRMCDALRSAGVSAWETMDAGPQVKIACLDRDLDDVLEAIGEAGGSDDQIKTTVTQAGAGPTLIAER